MTDLSKGADTLGYSATVPAAKGSRFLHNQRLGKVLIRPGCPLKKEFLAYLLRSRPYRNEVLAGATGTTVKHTSPGRIAAFRFMLPPQDEQEKIAQILGSLDNKVAFNRRMNESLEGIAHAIFKSWFVDFDPIRAKAEGREPFGMGAETAAKFPSSFQKSPIGAIPKGWDVGPILTCATLLSGGTPKTDNLEYWDGDFPWASAKDVSQCSDTFLVDTERTITKRGVAESATQVLAQFCTVVVARGATTGRMVLFGRGMAMNQTCYALSSTTNSPFLLYCLLRSEIEGLVHAAHGSVFDTITTRTFESSRVVLPPLPLAEVFEAQVTPLFQRILTNTKESSLLANIRDTLLPKLLSGEIRVNDAKRTLAET